MSEAVSTPRVSARTIEKYSGRNVMLVGQVMQLRGDVAQLEADGIVSVQLDRVRPCSHITALPCRHADHAQDAHLTPGNYAQLIGKVLEDSSLKVLTSRDLGADVGKSEFRLAHA